MAHNGYYPPQTPQHGQQVPMAQQQQGSSPGGQQYPQYYQQPQNIYQQLGQSQPQPHLQRFYQQPQFQQQPVYSQPPVQSHTPVQSHGFVQRPLSASFQAPQQSFVPPFQQQPHPVQQQPFQGSQFASLQQPPQPLSRAPSASGFAPSPSFGGQPPPQGFANVIQGQPAPALVPDPKPRPPIAPSAMLAHHVQRRTPQPPPPAQAQMRPPQPMQLQQQRQQPIQMSMQPQQPPVQQVPQTPNHGSRRPLPQPAGGSTGPTPPPSVGLGRSGTMASRPVSMPPTATGRLPPISTSNANFANPINPNPTPQPMSASAIPPPSFVQRQIQQIQQMQNEGKLPGSSSSTSPTKGRPLPSAPGVKPSSIDLGQLSGLPSVNTGSGFNFNPTSPASPSMSSGMGISEDGPPLSASPTKRMTLPSPSLNGGGSSPGGLSSGGGGGGGSAMSLSRTTSMAFSSNQANNAALSVLENNDNDHTPKRRASPPKFGAGGGSNGSSLSSSPTKEDGPRMGWNSNAGLTGSPTKSTVFGGSNRSSTNLSSTSLSSGAGTQKPGTVGATVNSTTALDGTTPKKFTPVWKRTIPDYPAPVFGYAAGMVADPFAKPSNASSPNLSSSPTKSDAATPMSTPKAASKQSAAALAKEKKKQEKEEKKRLKEEEKQRKKMAKANGGNLGMMQQQQASPGGSPGGSGGSMLPYLNPTPPRAGEHSKAYAHGHSQIQNLQHRIAMQKAHGNGPYSTPTRQIQVRGQPVPPGAVRSYSQPLAQVESPEDDDDDDDEEEEEEEEEQEQESEEEDLEVAYQYEGSDYSSASEQEYAMAPAPQRQRHQVYAQQQQQQQYMAPTQQMKKPGTSPRQHQQYDEYQEQQQRPSPSSRHVKTRSSASDGFVVIDQSGNSPGGRGNKANNRRSMAASSSSSRPPSGHARAQSHSYSQQSEDDWEQLQAYESPPKKSKAKGKGRRYEEPSEDDEEDEDEEEEMRYEERSRGRGSGHRREPSERDGMTVRKQKSREPEYDDYAEARGGRGTAKQQQQQQQQQGKNVKGRVQDIDWSQQQPKPGKFRQYQQQLKHDDDDDEDDERGRRKKSTAVAKKPGNMFKDMLRSRSRSRGAFTEPEDDEDQDEYVDDRRKSQSQSPTKKPGPRKLVKKNSRRYLNNAASETDSQAESRDGDDNESIATTNTQNTTESATGRLASKFAGVLKFTGGSGNQQPQKQAPPQKSPTREWPPQQQQQTPQPQQRQSGFQQGFQNQRGNSLYFGISDSPPASAAPTGVTKQPSSAMVRGEVNRGKVNLKPDTLDDPPPRSLRTPSPAPGSSKRQSMYQYQSEVEQQRQPIARQPQGPQQKRPQSQIYSGTPKSSFMDDIPSRSSNSAVVQPQSRRLPPQPQQQQQQRQRPQSQGNQPAGFDSITGLPIHHQQAMQGYAPPPAPLARQPSQQRQPPPSQFNNRPSAPSTPHQQQPINIESPAPLKMANIIKMEADGVAHEEQQLQRQQTGSQYQNVPAINIGGPQDSQVAAPRINIHHTGGTNMSSSTHHSSPSIPMISFDPAPSSSGVPMINVSESSGGGGGRPAPPNIQVFEVPGVSVSGPEFDEGPPRKGGAPQINISVSGDNGHGHHGHSHQPHQQQRRPFGNQQATRAPPARSGTGGLICGGCQGPIVGRIVSAMGVRWHPQCFRCSVCEELLEHVSSYEHDGRPYCHLDYHESFAPRCYSCKTPIIEEQFISLDDPALGKRTYHMEHFFCAECGDPFLTPSMSRTSGELALSGDGEFEGFTVYKGHPYCEACHVRLRLPKCKKCKKSIRDHERAVEALGGKWCWACFVCDGCEQPFEDPSFFQRDSKPYCENCFSIILRNEI